MGHGRSKKRIAFQERQPPFQNSADRLPVATFASVAVRCLFASFAPAQFLRDHGNSRGVPGYFDRFVESKRLLTNRPLRHAEISTGSPRLFHWVTQGFAWVTQASPVFPDQQRVSFCSAALWLNADGCC